MKPFFLYILKCNDGSYYIGHTDNVEKRISEHKNSFYENAYTSTRLPFEVAKVEIFSMRYEVLVAERKIKKWNRKKKEAYIQGDWELLTLLAKRKKREPVR